ncbi:MAG: diadenylate cyclase [Actinomycetota bacterium]|nr:diadenylate cyclase [Actinomycetota bacterium]
MFEQIGFGLGARAYLVGFTANADAPFPICFEPETDALAAVELSLVDRVGQERYEANPWSDFRISSPRHHDQMHRYLLNRMRGEVIRDGLEASEPGGQQYFFVGEPGLVNGFAVHPVIAVPRRRWDSKPALSRREIPGDRFEIVPSLQHSLIRELLRQATADLSQQDPPEEFSAQWSDRSELIRRAARALVGSACRLSGDDFSHEIVIALDEVSAQPYEGRASAGGFVIADPDGPNVLLSMKFSKTIGLPDTRSLRKSLEMSGDGQYLLCREGKIHGMARVNSGYDPADESVFTLDVVGRGAWELRHLDVPLLRVTNTRPSLPTPRIDESKFLDTAERVLSSATPVALGRLWRLTLLAAGAKHGSMLVVHPNAETEALRFLPQAQLIEPVDLDDETFQAATSIDGAVLLGPDSMCHAVGVILDGEATGEGLASRGARFNSAVRYHAGHGSGALIVVVSEDGMIDLLPDLPRRVTRVEVEDAVIHLEETVTEDPDFENFFRRHDHIEALAFYLSAEQCERVNGARDLIETHRAQRSNLTLSGWPRFAPNSLMDENFFLD